MEKSPTITCTIWMLQIANLRFLPSFLGDVFWGEGLYFCTVVTAFFGDEVSPFAAGIFAALVMMYYWRRYYVVGNGPEGRSLYCLNLNCRASPGRLFQPDLTGWWRDV